VKSVFVGPRGLRPGWGFAIFAILWIVLSAGLQVAVSLVYRHHAGMDPRDFLVSDGLSLAATFVVLVLMARIEKRRVGDYGLSLAAGFVRRWALGLVWGLAPVAVVMLGIRLLGGVEFHGWAMSGGALAGWAAIWAISMVVLGLFEETLFRGYPLVTLARGMGFWPAAVLLSVIFGALHYFTKPMESLLDAVSVALIGLFACYTFRRTGDLWLAAGFHTAFDFFALGFFGAPNTGNGGKPVPFHLLATTFHGPAWLTGGPCGMEASVLMIATVGMLFLIFGRVGTDHTQRNANSEDPPPGATYANGTPCPPAGPPSPPSTTSDRA